MRVRRVPPPGEKIDYCDRCGGAFEVGQLRRQNGGLVCFPPWGNCYDEPRKQKSVKRVRY